MGNEFSSSGFQGKLGDLSGHYVFNKDGYYLGFIPDIYKNKTCDVIVPGPDGKVALVILRNGELQNPDGTSTNYTDPILYLIEQIQPVINQKLQGVSQTIDEKTLPFGLRPFPFNVGGIEFYLTMQPNDQGLFALLGAVLADIQSFETLLCDLLAILDTKAGRSKSNANYEQLLSENYSKTLGAIVRAFRHYLNDTETADVLSYAKDRRNFLVHNILRKYGWWMMSDAEFRVCIYEIFEIRSAIKMAEGKLVKYLNVSNTLPIIGLDLDSLSKDINEDSTENRST